MATQLNPCAPTFANHSIAGGNSCEVLYPAERQYLDLGAAQLERIVGGNANAENDVQGCRLIFQPEEMSGQGAGTWSAGAATSFNRNMQHGEEVLVLSFPFEHLSRSLACQMQNRGVAPIPIRGASQMCLEVSRSCLAQAEPISSSVAYAVGDSLVELAKLAIIEQLGTKRTETVRETVRTRIQAFIQRNLVDPELTIERIANRMQCTKRYLHNVFSDEGQTLNQYIWSQRLEMCRDHLSQADLADKSITEIAFGCGFSNAAHFSRSFRARFGEAPRAYRRAALDS